MSEDRMGQGSAPTPNDPFDDRLARYLRWESDQVSGARSTAEVASSISAGGAVRRAGGVPALAWAVVVLALLGVAVLTMTTIGRPPQLVVAPTAVPTEAPSSAPSDAPETDAPPTDVPVTGVPIDPSCMPITPDGRYLMTVGTLPVSLLVPLTFDAPWRGSRDEFFLGKGTCHIDTGAPQFFQADLVGEIYADACQWKDRHLEVPTAFDLVQALEGWTGPAATDGRVDADLGPFRATRLDINVPSDFDASACDQGELRLWGNRRIIPGFPMRVYVAEIDGSTLALTVTYDPVRTTDANLQEIDAILASLRVEI